MSILLSLLLAVVAAAVPSRQPSPPQPAIYSQLPSAKECESQYCLARDEACSIEQVIELCGGTADWNLRPSLEGYILVREAWYAACMLVLLETTGEAEYGAEYWKTRLIWLIGEPNFRAGCLPVMRGREYQTVEPPQ